MWYQLSNYGTRVLEYHGTIWYVHVYVLEYHVVQLDSARVQRLYPVILQQYQFPGRESVATTTY